MAIISNGTTIADAGAFSVNLGSLVHIKTLTASSSSSLSFVDGSSSVVLDSTYPIYKFEFINIHASSLDARLTFQCATNGSSNYNITVTSSSFRTFHDESNSLAIMGYQTSSDQAQGTSFERITESFATNNDDSASGYLQIFNPSSTTFVKHFIANTNVNRNGGGISQNFQAGYFNTTSSINAIKFQMNSGSISSGKIKLYGIKDS